VTRPPDHGGLSGLLTRLGTSGAPCGRDSQGQAGWIEVISGSIFSGKAEELIRRLRRAQIARQSVAIFKPRLEYPVSKIQHPVSRGLLCD